MRSVLWVVVVLGLVAAACSGDSEPGNQNQAAGLPVRPITPFVERGNPSELLSLPMSFDYGDLSNPDNQFGRGYWEMNITGLVAGETWDSVEEPGSCLLLYGTIQPLRLSEERSLLASTYEAPRVSLSIDGELKETEGNGFFLGGGPHCDVLPAVEAGYLLVNEGAVGLGAVYPIYAAWFVPEGASVEHLVIGDPEYDQLAYFRADQLAATIEAPDLSQTLWSVDLLPFSEPVEFPYSKDNYRWRLSLDGFQQVPLDEDVGQGFFDCWLLTGELTLLENNTDESRVWVPTFGVVADGRFRDDFTGAECDPSSAIEAGYAGPSGLELQPGESIDFYRTFYVESAVTPNSIGITTGPQLFFELPG